MKAWIARDRNGYIYIFGDKKPYKDEVLEAWYNNTCFSHIVEEKGLFSLSEGINPKWSDEEPIEVVLKISRRK